MSLEFSHSTGSAATKSVVRLLPRLPSWIGLALYAVNFEKGVLDCLGQPVPAEDLGQMGWVCPRLEKLSIDILPRISQPSPYVIGYVSDDAVYTYGLWPEGAQRFVVTHLHERSIGGSSRDQEPEGEIRSSIATSTHFGIQ